MSLGHLLSLCVYLLELSPPPMASVTPSLKCFPCLGALNTPLRGPATSWVSPWGYPQTLRFTSPPSFSSHPICCQVLLVCPNHLSHPFISLHPHHPNPCQAATAGCCHYRMLPLVSQVLSCPAPNSLFSTQKPEDLPKIKSDPDLPSSESSCDSSLL